MTSSNLYAKPTLEVGHMLYSSLDATPKDIKTSLSLWMEEMSTHIDLEINSHFYTSIETLKKDLEEEKINYMIVKSIDVIKYFDYEKLIEGYSPARKKSASHNTLMIITHKNSKIDSIEDLKGKRVGFYTNDAMDIIYLDTILLEKNLENHENYFSKVVSYKKRSKVLLDVFFRKVDVAVVTQGTLELVNEMNPQVGRAIKIIDEKSFALGMTGFFSKNVDKSIVNSFYNGMEDITNSERAKQILTVFKADILKITDKEELRKLQEFYEYYQRLNKRKGYK